MQFLPVPSIPRATMLLVVALFVLWFGNHDYGEARRAYRAAASGSQATYVVDGRRSEVVGSGKGRHTEYFLQLARSEPSSGAPATTELRVTSKVYEGSRKGDTWRARVAGGPVFDPDLSGVEREKRRWAWAMALVLALAGGAYLSASLRRR